MRYQNVAFPLGRGGLDGKSDPTAVPFGKLVTAKNCDLSTPGVIKKRVGFTSLSMPVIDGSGTLGADFPIERIAARKQELIAYSDDPTTGIFSKHVQGGGTGWVKQTGRYLPIHLYYQRPAAFEGDARTQDQASSSQGLSVYAWEDGNGSVNYVTVDRDGARASALTSIPNAVRPKVLNVGASGLVWLMWIDTATWFITKRIFTPGSTSTADVAMLGVAAATSSSFDVARMTNGDVAVGATSVTVGTVGLRVFPAAGGAPSSSFDWPAATIAVTSVSVAVDPGNSNIGAACHNNTDGAFAIIRTSTLTAVAASTSLAAATTGDNITCVFDSTNALRAFFSRSNPTTYLYEVWAGGKLTTGGVGTNLATVVWKHSALASKPWRIGTGIGLITCYDSAGQATYFINAFDTTSGWSIQGTMLPDTAGGITVRTGHLPQVEDRGSSVYFFAALKRSVLATFSDTFTSNGSRSRRQIVGISMRVQPTTAYSSAVLNESLYIAGAQLIAYDGAAARAQGFHLAYENRSLSATPSAASGLLSVATYYYRIYPESYNAQGERELGTCMAALVGVVTGGNDTLTLNNIQTLFQVESFKAVGLAVYRAGPNPTAATPFNRVSSTDPTATGANGYVANSTTADTVTFVDKMSDAVAATQELDYQNSGELDNLAAPPCRVIAASGTRLFVAGTENGNDVWASKLMFPGQVAAFNDALVITVPDDGGDITALAVYDNLLFIFKSTKVYAVNATGPDNLGQGTFDEPTLVTSDVGAIDWRSIVVSKLGVFFLSYKGLKFVGPDRQVQAVGLPAESFFAGAKVISAVAPANTNLVRFQLDNGTTMVFDYELGAWTMHTDPGTMGQVAFVDQTGAAQLYIAKSDTIYAQSASVWTDAGVSYEMRWKTGVLPFDGSLQNVKRLRGVTLVGTFRAAHTVNLAVSLYQGGSAPAALTTTWAAASAFQHRYLTTQQRCEAVQIEVFESAQSGTNQGAEYNECALELGGQGKPFKLPVSATG